MHTYAKFEVRESFYCGLAVFWLPTLFYWRYIRHGWYDTQCVAVGNIFACWSFMIKADLHFRWLITKNFKIMKQWKAAVYQVKISSKHKKTRRKGGSLRTILSHCYAIDVVSLMHGNFLNVEKSPARGFSWNILGHWSANKKIQSTQNVAWVWITLALSVRTFHHHS